MARMWSRTRVMMSPRWFRSSWDSGSNSRWRTTLDVAGQDAAEPGPPASVMVTGGALVGEAGAARDQARLLQQAGLVGQAAAAVDDAVGQVGHGRLPAGVAEAGQELELHVAEVAVVAQLLLDACRSRLTTSISAK